MPFIDNQAVRLLSLNILPPFYIRSNVTKKIRHSPKKMPYLFVYLDS